ncbi:zinc finger protein 91-like isoform X2 [Danaus plexippus]|uniref:zinc finger protein 91-like isoform X2 n=1 Tax=Danaus plexippus TaxID=13037 RepID=UPI002AB0A05E|nr:zinc finger protein 91-like isoform X2 [Danaus plexippus]
MMEPQSPLILCMENVEGQEVALKIEPSDTFQIFLDNSKLLLGFEVDINSITGNQPVSLSDNIYTFLLNAEKNVAVNDLDQILDQNPESDDLVYVLDDGTQIRASQIQFDNEDPLIDLTAEKIPFVKYNDDGDEDVAEVGTVKDVNIIESPVTRWSKDCSPKCSFANSLPFKLVCNNTSNFDAQFSKYLEPTKTYTTLNPANRNKSPRSLIRDNYKNYDERNDFFTREDILNMFKDSPVTSLPCDGQNYEKRRHVRKTDPSRSVHKSWNYKTTPDVDNMTNNQDCFICGKIVENNEKLYLFDKEDQMLHRCEQRKFQQQLKIICERCLNENFKPSRMKSPSQSLNNDEYLVIKNNQQYIFQKITTIDLKKLNVESNKNSEYVKVEIGPDGEIITKPIDNDVNDVMVVKDEKKESSSDVEIIEPEVEIDIDNIEEADEQVKEFLGKYQCDATDNKELKCRFCERVFTELDQVIEHGEEHRHDVEDETVFPCPLCDYGYANFKYLKAHLKAAHINNKDSNSEEHDDKNTPKSSPVAKRTRSAVKKHDNENDDKNEKNSEEAKASNTFTTEVKQECVESSDESIWIVQTGDDDEQLNNLLQVKDDERDMNDRKKHKCFNCSQIFPTAESLASHKCRKRGRKRKSLLKDESVIFVPSEEDFLKRAQGRLGREGSGTNDLLVMRSRKKKNRDSEPQIVTCHNCNESFTSKVRLKFHMQFHDTTNLLTPDGRYVCSECENAEFATETELFDHVHFQHDKQKRWQCPVKDCGKTFFLRATLTKHSRTHTDTRRYVCVTCGKRFLDKQTLDEHGVTHLQIKPFQCHICLKQLTRRSRLRMHLRAHEEELSPALVLVCAICNRAFRDHVDAQEHATKSSECIEEFTNELKEEKEASEQLSPTSGLVRHTVHVVAEYSHNKAIDREVNNAESEALLSPLDDVAKNIIRVVNIEKAFRCEYCEDVFYLEDALNNHRVIHKGVQNPFTCHICKVSFATYSRCTTHKTTHGFYKRSTTEGNEGHTGPASAGILGYGGFPVVKHFLCEDCGRSYLHWTYLQVHRRMKHANENYIFKCNQCELTFPNSWSVAYHRKKVHGKSGQDENGGITKIIRDNRIPCRDCDQTLPNKIELYKHRKKEHCDEALDMDKEGNWSDQIDDASTTVCSKCGHNLHNVTALQKHVKEVHGYANPHSCPVCGRSFRSASIRNEHVRTHTGERPYPCDVCGVAFRRSTAMRNHRLIHTGVRAWACLRCPKRFRIKSDLKTHLRLKHPAHLAVIEVEGTTASSEDVQQHLTLNNINQDKVIEITMITFAKDTTNIVPNSSRALGLLNDVPRTRVVWERPAQYYDVFQPRRGRGIAKTPRRPKILRGEDLPQDENYPLDTDNTETETDKIPDNIYPVTLNADGEFQNLSTLNVQLLLQDGALVNGNQMVELQLNDEMLLE